MKAGFLFPDNLILVGTAPAFTIHGKYPLVYLDSHKDGRGGRCAL